MRNGLINQKNVAKSSISEFDGVHRYFDEKFQGIVVKIAPGEFYVTNQDEIIATVLGSCVSACIRDKELGIGGMNHSLRDLGSDAIASEGRVVPGSRSAGRVAELGNLQGIAKRRRVIWRAAKRVAGDGQGRRRHSRGGVGAIASHGWLAIFTAGS